MQPNGCMSSIRYGYSSLGFARLLDVRARQRVHFLIGRQSNRASRSRRERKAVGAQKRRDDIRENRLLGCGSFRCSCARSALSHAGQRDVLWPACDAGGMAGGFFRHRLASSATTPSHDSSCSGKSSLDGNPLGTPWPGPSDGHTGARECCDSWLARSLVHRRVLRRAPAACFPICRLANSRR